MYEHMQNGTELDESNELLDAQIEEALASYEQTPLLIRKLTSHNIEDLKTLSEVPRRLVFGFTHLDEVIEARGLLHKRMWEGAQNEIERAEIMIAEADEMLEDDDESNDAAAYALKRKAILKKRKQYNRLMIAQKMRADDSHLLKTFRKSTLEYLQGVDRKGRTEIVDAYQAIAMFEQNQGDEVHSN